MEISTELYSLYKLGDFKYIFTLLKESGFTAYDFSMNWEGLSSNIVCSDNYIEKAKKIRNIADEVGIKCNQSHAPLTRERLGEFEYGEKGEELLKRAIQISGVLGAKICVIHQPKLHTAQENFKFFKKFEGLARHNEIKIALENLWNWNKENDCAKVVACSQPNSFKEHLDLLDKDVFVGCIDIGHAEMKGLDTDAVSMIKTLGNRIGAMHLHDNDKHYDWHWMPFTMKIDFEGIFRALKEVGYSGDITFETDNYINKFPVELVPSVLKQMVEIAKYFKKKLEE